jgi:flagellar motility protein MotE (MotC chaperone)
MTPSIRLLPLLVTVSVFALGVRVSDIVTGESRKHDILAFIPSLRVAEARAEAAPSDKKEAASSDKKSETAPDAQSTQVAAQSDAKPTKDDLWVDPEQQSLGKAEMRLLQDLSARREALDKRERGLQEREALLSAAETQVDQKITELSSVRKEIQELLKVYDQKQNMKMDSLVKIYEAMKPADAARIFDNLDMDVLLQVVTRMKESKTAPVLAQMDAARAKELTLQLADRGKMPQSLASP